MIENRVRRYASFLLATTTFIVVPCLGEAWAKDDAPPAASAGETAKKKNTARDASAQAIQLDTINVQSKKRARRRVIPAAAPAAPPTAAPAVVTNAGGDIGYHANSTSSATKTNTPLRDIPQSITVVTKQQVQDIGPIVATAIRASADRRRRLAATAREGCGGCCARRAPLRG